jgi:anti-sigma28 factor (negative regulator of flagellin synthesis)
MLVIFQRPLKDFAIAADMSFSQEWAVVMRVNDHNVTGAAAAEAGRAQESQRSGRAGGSRPSSGSGGDRVELSSTLSSVSRAMEAHHTDRAARVQELAAQYQSGKYRPDAGATSRAMITEAVASGVA